MKHRGLWITLAVIGLILFGAYFAGAWYFSSIAIASPSQTLADGQADAQSFAELGVPEPETITIDTGEVELAGFLFENPADADCGVVLLHGYRGTRYGSLQYAPLFWERGCDILAYDHRGHGASTPSLHTFGYYEKNDVVAAVDWFSQRTGLDRSNIGVTGVSYGASTAIQAAPLLSGVPFIIADAPYRDLDTILRYQAEQQFGNVGLTFLPGALQIAEWRARGEIDDISAQNAIADAPMPVMIVHSQQDEYTPPFNSESIYAKSNQDRTMFFLNDWGAAHARDIVVDYEQYRVLVDQFLDTYAPDYGLPVSAWEPVAGQ